MGLYLVFKGVLKKIMFRKLGMRMRNTIKNRFPVPNIDLTKAIATTIIILL